MVLLYPLTLTIYMYVNEREDGMCYNNVITYYNHTLTTDIDINKGIIIPQSNLIIIRS